jgi:hypothetical protein
MITERMGENKQHSTEETDLVGEVELIKLYSKNGDVFPVKVTSTTKGCDLKQALNEYYGFPAEYIRIYSDNTEIGNSDVLCEKVGWRQVETEKPYRLRKANLLVRLQYEIDMYGGCFCREILRWIFCCPCMICCSGGTRACT